MVKLYIYEKNVKGHMNKFNKDLTNGSYYKGVKYILKNNKYPIRNKIYIKPPHFLYKYYPILPNKKYVFTENIKNSVLTFSSPYVFPDQYDSLAVDTKLKEFINYDNCKNYFSYFNKLKINCKGIISELVNRCNYTYKDAKSKYYRLLHDYKNAMYITSIIQAPRVLLKVASLTSVIPNDKNSNMWQNKMFSNCGKGICVEYNTSKLNIPTFKIIYTNNELQYNIFKNLHKLIETDYG